jgi:hypothetical protein
MIQKAAAVKMSAKAILFYDTNFSIRRAIALRPSKDFYVASKPTQQKLPRRQLTKKKRVPAGRINFFPNVVNFNKPLWKIPSEKKTN